MSSIFDLIQRSASVAGQKLALGSKERQVTYAQLLARASYYRDYLQQAGVLPGQPDIDLIGAWIKSVPKPLAAAFTAMTSGSTGLPTGIIVPHSTYRHRLRTYLKCCPVSKTSRILCCYPLSFSALRTLCFMGLAAGACCCFAPPIASGHELNAIIQNESMTEAYIAPVTLEAILETGKLEMWRSSRLLDIGSATASLELKERALRELPCDFAEAYSATSTGGLSFHTKTSLLARPDTVGKIFDGEHIEIADENAKTLGPGQHGLVRTRGPAVAVEMIGRHAGGDFVWDGWAYPGDIGFIDKDGYLTLVGRSNDMIVRGGEKIYPSESEAVLFDHPNVGAVAVVGIPNGVSNEEVVAAVCVRAETPIGERRAHCIKKLQGSKVPVFFPISKALPRNSNGKILRAEVVKLMVTARSDEMKSK